MKKLVHAIMAGTVLLLGTTSSLGEAVQTEVPFNIRGVTITDSYQRMHTMLFSSAENIGSDERQNDNDIARWSNFTDLTIFGARVTRAMLFTDYRRGGVFRWLGIWFESSVDFDSGVKELSRTNGRPDEVVNGSSQASPIAVWTGVSGGIGYELMFESGIPAEEGALLMLRAASSNNQLKLRMTELE